MARRLRCERSVRCLRRWGIGQVAALCTLVAAPAVAAPSGMEILNRALNVQRAVRDYTATVTVETNIPGLELPVRTAKVYVKTPDKTYVESEGIVAIPKRALLFGALGQEVSKHANVTLVGKRVRGDTTVYCLKVTPKSHEAGPPGQPPRVLVWVHGSRWTIDRLQVVAGDKVQLTVDFSYQKVQGIWMPTRVTSTVPKGVLGSDTEGKLTVTFSNYRLNTGLTDAFFAEKEKEQSRRTRGPGHHPHRRR